MSAEPLLEPQLRAMGARLREARVAQDINLRALETDLRTTHRHLLALEEGQTRLFYSDSFYCDLFGRYAQMLGFSQDEVQAMVSQLREPIAPPRDASAPAPAHNVLEQDPGPDHQPSAEPQTSIELVLPVTAPSISPTDTSAVDGPIASAEQTTASTVAQPSQAPAKKKSSFNVLQAGFVFLVIIVLAFLVSNPSEPETESSEPSGPQASNVTQSIQRSDAEASPAPEHQGVTSPTSAAVSASSPSAAATNPIPPATQVAATPPTSAPPIASPVSASSSSSAISATSPTPATTPVVSSEMELTFKTRGWIWVREADDSVREFVVPEGQTVRFQEIPIFIVLPAPDQIEVKVLGKAVALRRTEEDKNHGRFTRSMLRQAATSGRISAPASPQ